MSATGPILVYDGHCAFCTRAVQFVLNRDALGTLRFASRDGEVGRALRLRHPRLQGVESLLWVETVDGREVVSVYSDAVLNTATYLGGGYAILAAFGRWLPRFVRDPAYRLIARLRRQLSFGAPACRLPSATEQPRMLP